MKVRLIIESADMALVVEAENDAELALLSTLEKRSPLEAHIDMLTNAYKQVKSCKVVIRPNVKGQIVERLNP